MRIAGIWVAHYSNTAIAILKTSALAAIRVCNQVDVGATCNSWTDESVNTDVGFGSTAEISSLWTGICAAPVCAVPMHLYCFKQ